MPSTGASKGGSEGKQTLGAGGKAAASGGLKKTCSTALCTSQAIRVGLCVRHGAYGVCSKVRCHTSLQRDWAMLQAWGEGALLGPRVHHQRKEEGGALLQTRWCCERRGDEDVLNCVLHQPSSQGGAVREARRVRGLLCGAVPHKSH
jgi:hypothetical protein